MCTTGVVVVVVVGGFSCFSTARYDDAHLQRVAIINARYAAEIRRQDQQYGALVAALDKVRATLIPIKPGSDAPVRRIDERDDIAWCRDQCSNEPARARCPQEGCQSAYLEALIKPYPDAGITWVTDQLAASQGAEIEAPLALSPNQEVLGHIDEQARIIAQLRAQARSRLASDRQGEIQASEQQRNAEIASGRAVRRARLQAAANASTAMERGPISANQLYPGTSVDPPSRVGECRATAWSPGRAPSSQRSQPPGADRSPARR